MHFTFENLVLVATIIVYQPEFEPPRGLAVRHRNKPPSLPEKSNLLFSNELKVGCPELQKIAIKAGSLRLFPPGSLEVPAASTTEESGVVRVHMVPPVIVIVIVIVISVIVPAT